mgnify:CR=1 FL=1|jgi:hypothetical protein
MVYWTTSQPETDEWTGKKLQVELIGNLKIPVTNSALLKDIRYYLSVQM